MRRLIVIPMRREENTVTRKTNLAARAGRWSAQHRKKAIFGWLAFVILAVVIGGSVGTRTLTDEEYGIGESGRADTVVRDNFPEQEGESVLVQSRAKGVGPGDPAFKAVVADLSTRLERAKGVRNVESPYAKGNDAQISKDGRSVLVNFDLPGDDEDAEKLVDAPLAAVAATERSHEGFRVEEFGGASAGKALSDAFEDDFRKAEVTSLPITLIILILAFGALLAAFVPLILAVTAVAAAIGLIGPISQIWPVDESISSVVLLIGLAVGVDYSMFYLRREREERARGLAGGRGPRGRRRDLGPSGPDLGHHRHDRHGRDVLRRRRHVRVVRHRHDHGRRHRRARLAHRAAGGAVQARRPGEQGARAVPQAGAAHRRVQGLVLDPRPRAAAPAACRSWPAWACCWCWRCR